MLLQGIFPQQQPGGMNDFTIFAPNNDAITNLNQKMMIQIYFGNIILYLDGMMNKCYLIWHKKNSIKLVQDK